MIPLNQKGPTSRNRLLWISIFFAISLSANADENNDAEYHFQIAKQAYEENKCKIVIDHFKEYLAIAEEVEQMKKDSIKKVIAWCENYEDTFKEVRMVITGGSTILIKNDPEEQTHKRQTLFENKPATVIIP